MENYRVADLALAPTGHGKIDWAWRGMPVLRLLEERFQGELPFAGVTLGACLHLEAKTACLLLVLQKLGARVVVAGSNPLSTQDDVCAGLVERGVHVFSRHGMGMEEYRDHLMAVLDAEPQVIIDDGSDLVVLAHTDRRECLKRIRGGSEETTTGIKRLKAMEREGVLAFPMIAVNDAYSKYLFDNRYGTGQSVMDGLLRTTNLVIAGKTFVVAGYGWCGKGVARRAVGMGASVIVAEANPHRALEAHMDGFRVMDLDQAAACGDFFVTVTGNTHVLRERHFRVMKDGAVLANAGHFDVEICIPDLEKLATEVTDPRANIRTYRMDDGRCINLLAEGRLVNLAAADGHPIEIMDLSFASQLLAARHILEKHMEPGLYKLPLELDREVARLKLQALGLKLEHMSSEQEEYLRGWEE